jgi:hypothetical protein
MVDYSPESEESTFDNDHGADTVGSSATLWMWSLLLAGVLCLITESALAGVIVPVMAAVQPSFRAAKWIRKNDPHLHRAKACSRFMLATGCWSALCTGFVALAVLVGVMIVVGQPPTEAQGIGTILVIACAATATCLVGCWATWTAWTGRVRVWAHPKLMSLASYNFDNLHRLVLSRPTSNHAVYVTAVSFALPVMLLGTGVMIVFAVAGPPVGAALVAVVGGFGLLIVGPVVAIVLLITMSNRLFANGPADCWSTVAVHVDETEE